MSLKKEDKKDKQIDDFLEQMKTQLKKELEKLNDFSQQQVITAKIVLST